MERHRHTNRHHAGPTPGHGLPEAGTTRRNRHRHTAPSHRPASATRDAIVPAAGRATAPRVAGGDLLAWLDTGDAHCVARRLAARYRLAGWDAAPDNVVAEARVRIWQRLRSDTPLEVHSAPAYGTAVIRSVLVAVLAARARADAELPASLGHRPDPTAGGAIGAFGIAVDELRDAVAALPVDGRAWLTDAALAYIDLAVGDLHVTASTPQPRAGATPDQARAWAALWHVGQRDLFPTAHGDPRRRRARRVHALLRHLRAAHDHHTPRTP